MCSTLQMELKTYVSARSVERNSIRNVHDKKKLRCGFKTKIERNPIIFILKQRFEYYVCASITKSDRKKNVG